MIAHYGNVIICYDPQVEYHRRYEGRRWCFHCRKRYTFVTIFTKPVDPWSYYGPNMTTRCTVCDTIDADLFPGWTREWEG